MATFHDPVLLYNNTLSSTLNDTIINCLPISIRLHDGVPVNHAVCKHSDESPSVTVSKVGSDKAIPMMDILTIKSIPLDVQYDTGCQLSLINTSTLKLLLQTSYSLGNINMINLLANNGTSELLPATEVKLNLGNRVIKLIAVDSNLNCGSAYSFPTPHKWRKYTKYNVTSHSGKVAILLGGDNYHCHPSHVKEDEREVTLLRSKLSGRHMIFCLVNCPPSPGRSPRTTSNGQRHVSFRGGHPKAISNNNFS